MKKSLVALTIAAAAVPMLFGVAALPRPGDGAAPVHAHVSARYIAGGAHDSGADNLVTGVLLNYRAFDTFGEVMIIFAALAAVMAVLTPAAPGGAVRPPSGRSAGPGASPVVAFIIRLTAPFIALFGAFVIFKGHVSPGGGFQGGVILGSLLMLLSVVMGRDARSPMIPVAAARWLQAAAPVTFAVVGLFGLWLTGALLGFPVDPGMALARELMMIALELGIGIGGATIILGVFLAMRGD
jgi:multicomponent Na+:H+ antiporter subunit B